MSLRTLPFLIAVFALTSMLTSCHTSDDDHGSQPDLILHNATIYTVDDNNPWAQAIAIKGNAIMAVGTNGEVLAMAGDNTRIEDVQQQLMLPGFVDSHSHPIDGGTYATALSLDTFATPADWVVAIGEYADQHPDAEIIFGYGFLASAFGAEGPTRQQIDSVVADRPVFIMDEGFHGGWGNTAALEKLGLDANSVDPNPGFSYYRREADGYPSGYFLEATATLAVKELNIINRDSVTAGAKTVFQIMNSYGITSSFDAGTFETSEYQLDVLADLQSSGDLTVRYVGAHMVAAPSELGNALSTVAALTEATANTVYHVNTLKVMNDGTIEGKTAAMFEDYQGDPGNKGKTVFSQQQMNNLISDAASRSIDVHIHGLGERAVTESLNAIEAARATHPNHSSRFTICHVQVLTDSDITRFAKLNVTAQSTPLWTSYDETGKAFVSDDQFNRYFRFNSLNKQGVTLSFGSDYPASGAGTLGISPMFNIEVGHTRQYAGERDAPVQPNITERLDIASLVRGYTLGGAYQMRLEKIVGSLEVGKRADLIVLDKNIFTIDPYSLSTVKVVSTMFDGKVVYSQ